MSIGSCIRTTIGWLALVSSCSNPPAEPAPAPPGDPPADMQAFAAAYCELVAPCCGKSRLPTDGVQCRALMTAKLTSGIFDRQASEVCLDEVRAAARTADFCEPARDTRSRACDDLLRPRPGPAGSKPPGERCFRQDECAPSTEGQVVCTEELSAAAARVRVCQVQLRGKEGDGPCRFTMPEIRLTFPYLYVRRQGVTYLTALQNQFPRPSVPARAYLCHVADGLRCPNTWAGTSLDPARCARLAGPGERCDSSASCQTGAYCERATSTCQPRIPEGAPCPPVLFDDPCVEETSCDGTSRTCRPLLPLGATCQENARCRSGSCLNEICIDDFVLSEVCGTDY